MSAYDHLSALQRELDDYERGATSMERQMDKLIYENRGLQTKIKELEARLESIRLVNHLWDGS